MFYEAVMSFSVRVFSAARRQIGRKVMRLKPRMPKSELAHVRRLLSEAGGRNKVLICASGLILQIQVTRPSSAFPVVTEIPGIARGYANAELCRRFNYMLLEYIF